LRPLDRGGAKEAETGEKQAGGRGGEEENLLSQSFEGGGRLLTGKKKNKRERGRKVFGGRKRGRRIWPKDERTLVLKILESPGEGGTKIWL